ncbi:MAG: T9SS type A sorting domain-containing protein [Candidatus Delongbacteria bacterium]
MRRTRGWLFLALLASATQGLAALSTHRVESVDFPAIAQRDASRTDTTLYETNFNTGFEGWTSQDLTDQGSTWHMDSFNGVDGWNWWSGNVDLGGYQDHSLLYLELPPLNLSTTTNPQLTFDVLWALESPAGAPAPFTGWDACHVEVKVGAGAWQILTPSSPAYNVSHSFAFGEIFGQTVTAGWGGTSNGWQEAFCDLTAFRSQATRVRFAFASDETTSYTDDPSLTGMQLDNIVISDGAQVLLQNNADGIDFPGPILHYSGVPAAGDHFAISTSFHSGPFSLRCTLADQDVPIRNTITSTAVLLPTNYQLNLDFWTRVDMPDYDGNGDQSLDDYFVVEYSLNGYLWQELFFDYYDTETGSGAWYYFGDGGGHNRSTDISFLAGNTAFFRFRVMTDDNHDGGTGTGFYLDDFRVVGEPLLANDLGVTEVRLPYPRTEGRPIDGRASFLNLGSGDANGVQWGLYMDNAATDVSGGFNLPAGQRVDLPFQYTPSQPSMHFPQVRLLTADQYADNDRYNVPSFIVRPAGVLELANDYGWDVTDPNFLHTTAANEELGLGYLQALALPALAPSHGYALDSLRLRFASYNIMQDDTVEWRLRLWNGLPGSGSVIHESVHSYTPSYAGGDASEDWVSVVLSDVLGPFTENFWVEVVTLEERDFQTPGDLRPVPNVTLVPVAWETPVSYRVAGGSPQLISGYQFNFHAFGHDVLIDDLAAPQERPAAAGLGRAWPNPFNPATTVSYRLTRSADVRLALYDLQGRLVRTLVDAARPTGEHVLRVDGSDLASGLYLLELRLDGQPAGTEKLLLVK